MLSFDICETRSCVYVNIDTNEEDKRLIFNLERIPSLDSRISLNPASGQIVTTRDNDILLVETRVSDAGVTGAGSMGLSLTCIVRGGTSGTARFPSAEWWSGSTPVFPGEDSNLAETVKNATTSISFLSFSTLRTSHGGEYTCRGRVLLVTAEVIAASSPVDVVVRRRLLLMLNIILRAMCEEHPMKSL
jgi:hypothetical protein